MNTPQFDHEKLNVYHEALQFVGVATDLLKRIPKRMAVHNQLDRASTAIPLNIAEGSGKWTAPDRCRFFDTARGSALECAACLDVAVVKKMLRAHEIVGAKRILVPIVSMLVGLIKAVSPNRVYDDQMAYGSKLFPISPSLSLFPSPNKTRTGIRRSASARKRARSKARNVR